MCLGEASSLTRSKFKGLVEDKKRQRSAASTAKRLLYCFGIRAAYTEPYALWLVYSNHFIQPSDKHIFTRKNSELFLPFRVSVMVTHTAALFVLFCFISPISTTEMNPGHVRADASA